MQYKSERQRKAEQITVDRLDEVRAGIWFMEARNEDGEEREYTLVPEEFWSSVPDDRFRAWDEGAVSKYMRRAAMENEEFFQQLGDGVDVFEALPHEIGNTDASTADSGVPTSDPVAVEAARDALDEIEKAREKKEEALGTIDEIIAELKEEHGTDDDYEYIVSDTFEDVKPLSAGTSTHDVDRVNGSDDDGLSREIERLADLTDRIEELASDDG